MKSGRSQLSKIRYGMHPVYKEYLTLDKLFTKSLAGIYREYMTFGQFTRMSKIWSVNYKEYLTSWLVSQNFQK